MNRLARAAALAVTALAMVTTVANAGLPGPPRVTLPPFIVLVGHDGSHADSVAGHFWITVHDFTNSPIPFATVTLELADATDFRIAADQLDPRVIVTCGNRMLSTVADAAGVAGLTVVGGGRFPPGPPVKNRAIRVYIDGLSFATVPVCAYDLNGTSGIALSDLQLWGVDFFGSQNPTRSDFDGDGAVGLSDLSVWAAAYFSAGSTFSADVYCP